MIALAFLPALVVGDEENTAAAVNFQPICDFNANEIKRLKKNKEELEGNRFELVFRFYVIPIFSYGTVGI